MRPRFTVLAAVIVASALATVPGLAGAAPIHNRGLTIHAVPRSIIAGEAVLIYGQLKGPDHAGQTVRLYHRINPDPAFSLIGVTKSDSAGRYEFTRAEGIVETNRSWFVRGPALTHSHTVHERVQALVGLQASAVTGTTLHPITFSGHVTPNHAGGRVVLQAQKGSSDDWKTLKRGVIGPDSNYQIGYAWRTPGQRDVRVLFRGDARNTLSVSDPVAITIQQTQIADFTINTSDPIVANGSPSLISGILDARGTTTPEPATAVALFGHLPANGPLEELQSTTTGSDGSYSFTVQTTTNEIYQVRTVTAPVRHTARLFQGVQDMVTMTPSSTTSTVGGQLTFSGTVSPDKAGHVIYLQKLGSDNDWHTVEVGAVSPSSTFQFGWTFGTPGTKQFRARITGGPANVGGASPGVTIAVTPTALSSLPTG
jgi:hypothetical protein